MRIEALVLNHSPLAGLLVVALGCGGSEDSPLEMTGSPDVVGPLKRETGPDEFIDIKVPVTPNAKRAGVRIGDVGSVSGSYKGSSEITLSHPIPGDGSIEIRTVRFREITLSSAEDSDGWQKRSTYVPNQKGRYNAEYCDRYRSDPGASRCEGQTTSTTDFRALPDVDITPCLDCPEYTLHLTSTVRLYVEVFDAEMTSVYTSFIEFGDLDGFSARLSMQPGQRYWVAIESASSAGGSARIDTGTYSLQVTDGEPDDMDPEDFDAEPQEPDQFEPDDAAADAKEAVSGEVEMRTLFLSSEEDDVDWIVLEVPE